MEKINKTPQEIAKEDFDLKNNIYKEENQKLKSKMDEFGLESLEKFKDDSEYFTPFMKKGITYSQKDFEIILNAIKNKKRWAVVSGINPSGPLHLGHLALFKENLELQKLGADVFIPVSDEESYVFNKVKTLGEATKNAQETVIPSLIALGYNPEKTFIFTGRDYPSVYHFAVLISKYFSLNQLKGVFGFTDDTTAGVIFYTGAVQMAHILMPQLKEFGGPRPVVVQVGIDQHPYIQVSRRFAQRIGFIPPAELVLKFLPSLQGPENKMSASVGSTSIYLTDSVETAVKKIKTAYTGGSPLLEFQKIHGGVPDVCSVYGILLYHITETEKSREILDNCKKGMQFCKDCKKEAVEGIEKLLTDHQKKVELSKDSYGDFMIKTPIRSISE